MGSGEEPGYRERFITSRHGLRLYCRDYGDPISQRTPVFCLAGLARNAKDFDIPARRLAPKRRVIAFDYRGRGRSAYDSDPRRYRPEVYLDDAVQIMMAIGLHGALLVGTSLGGLLAMGIAVAQPGLVSGVVLNDIGAELDMTATKGIMEVLGASKPLPDWECAVTRLKTVFPNLNLENDDRWRIFAKATYKLGPDGMLHPDWDPRAMAQAVRTSGEIPDLWPYFRALAGVPTLAIRGALSDIFSEKTFQRMKQVKPDLMQTLIPNRGHAPLLDEPESEQAIDELLAWLDNDRN